MTIPAGQISVPFDVPVNDDNAFEENEEFLLTIDQSSSLNGVIIGSPNVTVVNISDNDGESVVYEVHYSHILNLVPSVSFSNSSYRIDEGDGSVQPMLILNVLLSTDITVRVFAVDASAAGEECFITISYILLTINCK